MTNLINPNHVFDDHGTTIDNAKQIAKEGLWPQTGGFTSQFYGDEYAGEDEEGNDLYLEDTH